MAWRLRLRCVITMVPNLGQPAVESWFLGLVWLFQFEKGVPEGCVGVTLVLECAVLYEVPGRGEGGWGVKRGGLP